MAVLITAGATRNPIDAVRFISARSTGRTGVAIARALRDRGVDVWLLGSPEARLRGPELPGEQMGSTRDLLASMAAWVRANPTGSVVHASAVGDYEVATDAGKIPSGQAELVLRLRPTPKIADLVRDWGCTGTFVTFKAAGPDTTDEQLVRIAQSQLERTGSDWVFANVLGRLSTGVYLIGHGVQERYEMRDAALEALLARL